MIDEPQSILYDEAEANLSPEGTDSDLLRKIKRWYRADLEHAKEWREEAKEAFDFMALKQWSEEDRKALEAQQRPVIVFDRIGPIIRSVVGQEVSNRQEVKYLPRTQDDVQMNEIFTHGAAWFRDRCDADSEDSDAFENAVICGMGVTETRLDFDVNPKGDPVIESIPPLEMLWDCAARRPNLVDARRVHRIKTKIPVSEARALFPREDGGYWSREELDAKWADETQLDKKDGAHSADPPFYDGKADEEDDKGYEDTVTIVQTQWWEREPMWLTTDPMTGAEETISEEMYEARNAHLAEVAKLQGIEPAQPQGVKVYRKVYRYAFTGGVVLDTGETLVPGHFNFKFITAIKDKNAGTFFGMVAALKDPQRWANKWLSQTLHILNSQAKGGILASRDAFDDPKQAEEDWAKANSIVWMKRGTDPRSVVMDKPTAQFPSGFIQLMEFAANATREASGVNLEQLGMREANQPGVLEYQRRQSGVTILAPIFDALRRYRQDQGKLLLEIMKSYLADGRLIRISQDQTQEVVEFMPDAEGIEFDVIVDEAPTAPNQKEQVWQVIQPMLPLFGTVIPPEVLMALIDYFPLPDSAIQAIREAVTPPEPTEEETKAQELELAHQEGQVRGIHAEAAKDEAQAQKIAMDAQLKPLQFEHEVLKDRMASRQAAIAPPPQPPRGPNQPRR